MKLHPSVVIAVVFAFITNVAAMKVSPSLGQLEVQRSQSEKRHFANENPCPVTGLMAAALCKGYVIDYIVPLCAGGSDKAENMQWQTVEYTTFKDKIEWGYCRCVRTLGKDACPQVNWTRGRLAAEPPPEAKK